MCGYVDTRKPVKLPTNRATECLIASRHAGVHSGERRVAHRVPTAGLRTSHAAFTCLKPRQLITFTGLTLGTYVAFAT